VFCLTVSHEFRLEIILSDCEQGIRINTLEEEKMEEF